MLTDERKSVRPEPEPPPLTLPDHTGHRDHHTSLAVLPNNETVLDLEMPPLEIRSSPSDSDDK